MDIQFIKPDKESEDRWMRRIFKAGFEAGQEFEARDLTSESMFRNRKFKEFIKRCQNKKK